MKKSFLFFGFEKSGQSAFNLIYNNNDLFYIYDENKVVKENAKNKIKLYLNAFIVDILDKELIKNITTIILSPGVSIYHWAIAYAKKCGVEVISEIELGYRYIKKSNLIAITGTNGKTTTTRLVEEILQYAGKNAIACGNIGLPLTQVVKNRAKKNTIFVCETSSFQLEAINKFKPKIACILNITPDHLNRHKTFKNYKKTKLNILKNLDKRCYFVVGDKVKVSSKNDKFKKYIFNKDTNLNCCYEKDGSIVFKSTKKAHIVMKSKDILLKGEHNLQNVLCAITVCKLLKIKDKHIKQAIINFKLNKHRLEKVFTHKNIDFYDDSKATNIDATTCAIKAFNNLTILILGGSDKGYEYDEIFKELPNYVQHVLCCGEVKDKIKKSAEKFKVEAEMFDSLKMATNRACEIADLYDSPINVLLSPASASFDEFNNYKERGENFLEYVKEFYEKIN